MLPLAQRMEQEKGESGREETKTSGEPAAFPGPNSKYSLEEPCRHSSSPRPVASGLSSLANIFLCAPGKIGPIN